MTKIQVLAQKMRCVIYCLTIVGADKATFQFYITILTFSFIHAMYKYPPQLYVTIGVVCVLYVFLKL
jgi:hypothetical protein